MVVSPLIRSRSIDSAIEQQFINAGTSPLLARLLTSRAATPEELELSFKNLLPPSLLFACEAAGEFLANAIQQHQKICIIADYDCDGATACAVALRAIRSMGGQVDFIVPDRRKTGYGLSPAIIDLVLTTLSSKPDILLTVDNGIASIEGVATAQKHGMQVVITDHHLAGDSLPTAEIIVNPNQPACSFPSKNLAGVGVIFYTMLALRAALRQQNYFNAQRPEPRLDLLLDLVALGTIADVVRLDYNNRILVAQGLERIRQKNCCAGILALIEHSKKSPLLISSQDLAFTLGPRINAAGRLSDMRLGILCLSTDDTIEAHQLANTLCNINEERRQLEADMREQALVLLDATVVPEDTGVCLYEPSWHTGIVGLIASKMKEKTWRPTIAFATSPMDEQQITGSGRSVPEVHLRDVLDLISKQYPSLILKFGGHAMAAGLTILKDNFETFRQAFSQAIIQLTGRHQFDSVLETDGSLHNYPLELTELEELERMVWGAGFPPPTFHDTFTILDQRILGEKHLKLGLEYQGRRIDAIWFGQSESITSSQLQAVYTPNINRWNGSSSIQFIIQYAESV